ESRRARGDEGRFTTLEDVAHERQVAQLIGGDLERGHVWIERIHPRLVERRAEEVDGPRAAMVRKNRHPLERHFHRLNDVVDRALVLEVLGLSRRPRVQRLRSEPLELHRVRARVARNVDEAERLLEVPVMIRAGLRDDVAGLARTDPSVAHLDPRGGSRAHRCVPRSTRDWTASRTRSELLPSSKPMNRSTYWARATGSSG